MPWPPAGDIGVHELAQAMGRVSVQADRTVDEARRLISDRAVVDSRTAYEIAAAVVDRTIRFGA